MIILHDINLKTYLAILTVSAFLSMLAVAGLNYVIDPLQYFRAATLYPPQYSENERFQNPTLIHSFDYDSILAGTSLIQNYRTSQIGDTLGGKWLRLSLSGGTAHEMALTLRTALDTGKVERIVMGMYWWTYARPNAMQTKLGAAFPYYLYEHGRLDGVRYIFNLDNLQSSIGILARILSLTALSPVDVERLNNWNNRFEFGPDAIAKFYKAQGEIKTLQCPDLDRHVQERFSATIGKIIRDHPHVRFDLILYPHTPLYYHYQERISPDNLKAITMFRHIVIDELGALDHVTVHDFALETKITHNLDNFKDLHHFSQDIGDRIIHHLAIGDYKAAPGTATECTERLLADRSRFSSLIE